MQAGDEEAGVKTFVLGLLLLVCSGCAVKRGVWKVYHFAYCNQMNPDGIHCDRWATPCGTLDCGKDQP